MTTTATLSYREAADDAITVLTGRGQGFTADDVRRLIAQRHPDVEPGHPNHLGLAFMTAAGRGRITRIDTVRTTRRERKASHNYVWIGATHVTAGGRRG